MPAPFWAFFQIGLAFLAADIGRGLAREFVAVHLEREDLFLHAELRVELGSPLTHNLSRVTKGGCGKRAG